MTSSPEYQTQKKTTPHTILLRSPEERLAFLGLPPPVPGSLGAQNDPWSPSTHSLSDVTYIGHRVFFLSRDPFKAHPLWTKSLELISRLSNPDQYDPFSRQGRLLFAYTLQLRDLLNLSYRSELPRSPWEVAWTEKLRISQQLSTAFKLSMLTIKNTFLNLSGGKVTFWDPSLYFPSDLPIPTVALSHQVYEAVHRCTLHDFNVARSILGPSSLDQYKTLSSKEPPPVPSFRDVLCRHLGVPNTLRHESRQEFRKKLKAGEVTGKYTTYGGPRSEGTRNPKKVKRTSKGANTSTIPYAPISETPIYKDVQTMLPFLDDLTKYHPSLSSLDDVSATFCAAAGFLSGKDSNKRTKAMRMVEFYRELLLERLRGYKTIAESFRQYTRHGSRSSIDTPEGLGALIHSLSPRGPSLVRERLEDAFSLKNLSLVGPEPLVLVVAPPMVVHDVITLTRLLVLPLSEARDLCKVLRYITGDYIALWAKGSRLPDFPPPEPLRGVWVRRKGSAARVELIPTADIV